MLRAAGEIGSDDMMTLKVLVCDLRHITGSDITDTDMARVVYFQNAMMKLLDLDEVAFQTQIESIKIARLVDTSTIAGQIFVERLERTDRHSAESRKTYWVTVEEASNSVGLNSQTVIEGLRLAGRSCGQSHPDHHKQTV